jgi:hypothetical protein
MRRKVAIPQLIQFPPDGGRNQYRTESIPQQSEPADDGWI